MELIEAEFWFACPNISCSLTSFQVGTEEINVCSWWCLWTEPFFLWPALPLFPLNHVILYCHLIVMSGPSHHGIWGQPALSSQPGMEIHCIRWENNCYRHILPWDAYVTVGCNKGHYYPNTPRYISEPESGSRSGARCYQPGTCRTPSRPAADPLSLPQDGNRGERSVGWAMEDSSEVVLGLVDYR